MLGLSQKPGEGILGVFSGIFWILKGDLIMANNKKPVSASKAPAPKVATRSATPTVNPPAKAASPVSTPVRNSAVPKSAPSSKTTVTHEMIAKRAYEISQSPQCGSQHDNWIRAERELRGA